MAAAVHVPPPWALPYGWTRMATRPARTLWLTYRWVVTRARTHVMYGGVLDMPALLSPCRGLMVAWYPGSGVWHACTSDSWLLWKAACAPCTCPTSKTRNSNDLPTCTAHLNAGGCRRVPPRTVPLPRVAAPPPGGAWGGRGGGAGQQRAQRGPPGRCASEGSSPLAALQTCTDRLWTAS